MWEGLQTTIVGFQDGERKPGAKACREPLKSVSQYGNRNFGPIIPTAWMYKETILT